MTHFSTSIGNQEESDFFRIVSLFKTNYKTFIFCVLIAFILTFAIIKYSKPVFRVSSSLMILEEDNKQGPNLVNEYINNNLFRTNQGFQNELYILQSSPVIQQTAENIQLTTNYFKKEGFKYLDSYKNTPIRVLTLKNHVQPVNARFLISIQNNKTFTIKAEGKDVEICNLMTEEDKTFNEDWIFEKAAKFGELIENDQLAFIIELDNNVNSIIKNEFTYGFEFSKLKTAVSDLKRDLSFVVVNKDATLIEIKLNSESSSKGIDILNELMNVYSLQNVNRKNHIANVSIQYIEQQLGEISDSLNQTEDNLQQFRSSRQILDVTNQASEVSSLYRDLQNQMAELLTKKRYYDYLADYLGNNNDLADIMVPSTMGVQDPVLNDLVSQLIADQNQRLNLIRNKQDRNPLVKRLEIQIENIKKNISDNISAVRTTTEISIDEMNKRIARVESEISRLPRTERQLGGIERSYRLNDAIYNYLLEKRAEAKISQASNLPDNIIIEPAYVDGITSPNPPKILMISLSASLVLPFLFFYFRTLFNEKFERIDSSYETAIVGKIPHNNRKTRNVVMEYPRSVIAEAYRTLRTNLEIKYKNLEQKVIIVTSSVEGEGKSFNVLNLAVSYAQLGHKTIIINMDMRRPIIYFSSNESGSLGISSYLTEKVELNRIILTSPQQNLDFIPAGPIPPNPLEILSSIAIKELIDNLKELYQCIIIDSTPLAQVADAYLLFDKADIKLIIARLDYTPRKILRLVLNDIRAKSIDNVSLVLNDNKSDQEQYGYGYGYEHKRSKWFKKSKSRSHNGK